MKTLFLRVPERYESAAFAEFLRRRLRPGQTVLVSTESEAAGDCARWNLPVRVQRELNADTVLPLLSSPQHRDTGIVILSSLALQALAHLHRRSYKPIEIGYERDWRIVLLQRDYDRFCSVSGLFISLQQDMDRRFPPLSIAPISQGFLALSLQNLQSRIAQVQRELTQAPHLGFRRKLEKVHLYLNYDKSILAINFSKKPIRDIQYQLRIGNRLLQSPLQYRGELLPGVQQLSIPAKELSRADVIFLQKPRSRISNELVIRKQSALLFVSSDRSFSVPTEGVLANSPLVGASSQFMQSVPRGSNP